MLSSLHLDAKKEKLQKKLNQLVTRDTRDNGGSENYFPLAGSYVLGHAAHTQPMPKVLPPIPECSSVRDHRHAPTSHARNDASDNKKSKSKNISKNVLSFLGVGK